jgi:hypothetical protein
MILKTTSPPFYPFRNDIGELCLSSLNGTSARSNSGQNVMRIHSQEIFRESHTGKSYH